MPLLPGCWDHRCLLEELRICTSACPHGSRGGLLHASALPQSEQPQCETQGSYTASLPIQSNSSIATEGNGSVHDSSNPTFTEQSFKVLTPWPGGREHTSLITPLEVELLPEGGCETLHKGMAGKSDLVSGGVVWDQFLCTPPQAALTAKLRQKF